MGKGGGDGRSDRYKKEGVTQKDGKWPLIERKLRVGGGPREL